MKKKHAKLRQNLKFELTRLGISQVFLFGNYLKGKKRLRNVQTLRNRKVCHIAKNCQIGSTLLVVGFEYQLLLPLELVIFEPLLEPLVEPLVTFEPLEPLEPLVPFEPPPLRAATAYRV